MTDTPEFYAILTEAGRALQFECLDSEKTFVMTEIAVGDGNGSYYEPDKTQTNLKNENYRHAVTRYLTDKKGLVKSVILDIPEQVSGFTVREVGVYGENGDLLIIGKYPATEKRVPESGATSQLAIKIDLTQINELVLPVLIDPSVNTASVQYVEEHFQALAEKGVAGGYAPLDPTAKVPQEMVQKPLISFCFNAGLVDTSGKAACVTVVNDTLTLAAGSVCTSAGGTTYTVPENISIDISSLTAGTHNLAYDAENQTIEEYSKVVISSTQPEDFSAGDIWLDNSVMPYSAKMKNSSGEIVAREIIPIPAKLDISTVSDGGGGLTLMPKTYNNNGLDADILKRSDFSELSGLSAPSDNLIPLAVPASNTTITAPATGTYYLKGTAGAEGQAVVLSVNGVIGVSPHAVFKNNGIQTCAHVRRGGKVLVFYNTPTIKYFGFCPDEGEVI